MEYQFKVELGAIVRIGRDITGTATGLLARLNGERAIEVSWWSNGAHHTAWFAEALIEPTEAVR